LPKNKQAPKVLRLLQLMQEADIFTLGANSRPNPSSDTVSITVSDGTKLFTTRFDEKDVEHNLKALLLLKLLKEYNTPEAPEGIPSRT
jgi:hypothetical protein